MKSRALNFAALALLVGLCGWTEVRPAAAQALDAGKPPAQIFSGTCSACHRSPRGLVRNVSAGSLPGFLRQHYTTGNDMAGTMAAYVLGNGGTDRVAEPAPKREPKQEARPEPDLSPDLSRSKGRSRMRRRSPPATPTRESCRNRQSRRPPRRARASRRRPPRMPPPASPKRPRLRSRKRPPPSRRRRKPWTARSKSRPNRRPPRPMTASLVSRCRTRRRRGSRRAADVARVPGADPRARARAGRNRGCAGHRMRPGAEHHRCRGARRGAGERAAEGAACAGGTAGRGPNRHRGRSAEARTAAVRRDARPPAPALDIMQEEVHAPRPPRTGQQKKRAPPQ